MQRVKQTYRSREYPIFSACGLNCGLCPGYHARGVSRCPGCAGEGFSDAHPTCGVLSCCQRKGLEFCFQCEEFPCPRYDGADEHDSFITHINQFRDIDKAKRIGLAAYVAEQYEKIEVLEGLLSVYNDGRRKSFFCLAVNLLDMDEIRQVVRQLEAEATSEMTLKEKAAFATLLFENAAASKGITLKLRKKPKSK